MMDDVVRNKNGFTLIELLAVLILLAIVLSLGGYSIINILNKSKEKNYQLLINNINSAVEQYDIECKYDSKSSIPCSNQIRLGDLVKYGYLKGNSSNDDDTSSLINPKDNKLMDLCKIRYSYNDGKIEIEAVSAGLDAKKYSCPSTCDFNPEDEVC